MRKIVTDFKTSLDYYFSEALNRPFARPYWVFFSLTHRCNFNCQMCGVKKVLRDQDLDINLLKKSLDEVAGWGTDCTVLFTGGEVFLRRDVFEIIRYSVSLGLKTEVVTNGSLIDSPQFAGKIMDSGLSNIAISLDGACAGTHDSIRAIDGAHAKAVRALRFLSEEKKRKGHGPQISVWVTIMKENVHELFDIIPLVKESGVECLVYHPVIVAQADMQNTIKGGSLWITPELKDVLKDQIDKIVEYKNKSGLVAFLHDPYQWLGYFQGSLTKSDWKCNPFVFVDVGPDGSVRSCGPSFGNIKVMSLNDCLKTDDARMARAKMRLCDKPCLQTCWARPEADSLKMIVNDFTAALEGASASKAEKKQALEAGLKMIDAYESLISEER
jgi:MoaA/NifB/PqqE/SkfB family radical SAM enzyme